MTCSVSKAIFALPSSIPFPLASYCLENIESTRHATSYTDEPTIFSPIERNCFVGRVDTTSSHTPASHPICRADSYHESCRCANTELGWTLVVNISFYYFIMYRLGLDLTPQAPSLLVLVIGCATSQAARLFNADTILLLPTSLRATRFSSIHPPLKARHTYARTSGFDGLFHAVYSFISVVTSHTLLTRSRAIRYFHVGTHWPQHDMPEG